MVKPLTPVGLFDSMTRGLLTNENMSALWSRFVLIFALDKSNIRYIYTSGIADLLTEKMYHYVSSLTIKIFTKFEVGMTIDCPLIAFLLLIRYVTLWPLWTFAIGQWSYMAGHAVNPSMKFEDPASIHSWVMSSDISHRIPLAMRLHPRNPLPIWITFRRVMVYSS